MIYNIILDIINLYLFVSIKIFDFYYLLRTS